MRLLVLLVVLLSSLSCGRGEEREPAPPPPTPTVSVPPFVLHRDHFSPVPVEPRPPTHLRVWHFDAPVIPVTPTGGSLVPPSDPQVLGWWGQPVGSPHGVTLLIGHTVSTGGGTFDDLELLPLGEVAVVSGVRYAVTSVRLLSKEQFAQESGRILRQSGPARLVLVTCEGYDSSTGEYDSNVVVTATP